MIQTPVDSIEEKTFNLRVDEGDTRLSPREKKTGNRGQTNGWKYVSLAGELGFDIALPMTGGLIIGIKLDEYWGSQPKATIGLFLLGLVISCTSLIRIVRDVARKR